MPLRSLLSLMLVAQLLSPGIGAASVQFLCAKDSSVHRSCCCEKGMSARHPCARLESADCCRVQPGADRAATRANDTPVMAPLLVEVGGALPFTATSVGGARVASAGGGAVGPPIFLRNCTILR